MPTVAPILFVHHTSTKHSQRSRELQDSERRAHAARHAQAQRQLRRRARPFQRIQVPPMAQEADELQRTEMSSSRSSPVQRRDSPRLPLMDRRRRLPGIINILGQANVDPFQSAAVENLPSELQRALDYTYETLWSVIIYPTHLDQGRSAQREWKRAAVHSPMVFHCQAASAASAALLFSPQTSESLRIFHRFHRKNAIDLINNELSHMCGPPSDALVMSLLNVGTSNLIFDGMGPAINEAPVSPLATAQNAHIYARAELDAEYVMAMYSLLARKGGLDNLHVPGLDTMIEAFDIMVASIAGAHPLCPWRHQPPVFGYGRGATHEQDASHHHPSSSSSFSGVSVVSDQALRQALESAANVTAALDRYQQHAPDAPRFSDIVQARNAAQHALCSLPGPAQTVTMEDLLYNTCRIAALIYSDFVLYPLPKSKAVGMRLSVELRHTLEKYHNYTTTHDAADFTSYYQDQGVLLWAATLGAMASSPIDRRWYVGFLAKLSSAVAGAGLYYVDHWTDVKILLQTYLWWDYVCDPLGERIWAEVFAHLSDNKTSAATVAADEQQHQHQHHDHHWLPYRSPVHTIGSRAPSNLISQ